MDNSSNTSINNFAIPQENFLYFSMSLVGVAVNIAVVAMVSYKSINPSKVARTLLIHQCVGDASSSLLNMLLLLSPNDYLVPANWLGDIICHFWYTQFFFWSGVQASIDNTVIFAVERYMSIVHPVSYQRLGMKHVTVAIIVCWLVAFAIESGTALEYTREGNVCIFTPLTPSAYIVYGTALFLIYFFVPLIVIVITYTKMIRVLRHKNNQFRNNQAENSRDRVARELSVTVGVAAVSFVVLHFPNAITYYLFTLSAIEYSLDGWLYKLVTFLVNLNFLINPIVYAVRLRPFQRFVRQMFSHKQSVHPTIQTHSVTLEPTELRPVAPR